MRKPKYRIVKILVVILLTRFTGIHPGLAAAGSDTAAVERWRVVELAFTSDRAYTDRFNAVDLDVVFNHGSDTSFAVPAFWYGGNTWMVRFSPVLTGPWSYSTVCTDTSNTGLHGHSGQFTCTEYLGDLDIYKHGFVKTTPEKRYFTYADGTPFFYLGDTHWNIPANSYENFMTIIDKRVEQGFTVIQSEPLGAGYNLSDGVSESDLTYFSRLDERFQYVADRGLVHANAQLVFVSELGWNRAKYPDTYLEKLCRYWVARYSAYPVMWTTAQECDDDFYYDRGTQDYFDAETNPWKLVAGWIYRYDPYKHPQTGHMENTSYTVASESSFRDLPGHSWWAAQWGPKKNGQLDFSVPRDFWDNGQGKPSVNYEGLYDHLWTNHYGARMQGWTAFLNGMYGHGYGAIDIWLYNSTYDMDNPTTRDGITITVEDKQTKWPVSLEFPSAYQMGYMHSFFDSLSWWELIPRFDDPGWFSNDGSWYSLATIENDIYVAYFYNYTHQRTGMLKNLDDGETYRARWYNPRDDLYLPISSSVIPSGGLWVVPEKPDSLDWVLLVTNDGERLIDQCAGRWRMESNVLDEYGTGSGTLMGGADFSEEETREGAFSLVLDGEDDRLVIPDHPGLDDLASFCLAFWMRMDRLPSDSMVVMEKNGAFRIMLDPGGRLIFSLATESNPWNSDGTRIMTGDSLESGSWHYIAAGYDGAACYLYLDGRLRSAGDTVLSGMVVENGRDLVIGMPAQEGPDWFSGQLDDLLFFRMMPDPAEISGLYSGYLPIARIISGTSFADFDDNGSEVVVLDGSTSADLDGSLVSHEWRDKEQVLGSGERLTAGFDRGPHTVILTVTDNNGITATDTLEVEITGPSHSRWSLEDDGRDSDGNNHGTLYGNPAFVHEDVMEDSAALFFDGVDDYLSISDNASLEGMDRFSFSFWVKPGEPPSSVSMILGKELAYRVLYTNSRTLSWVIATENNPWYSSGTVISEQTRLPEDEWNHLVAGYDGTCTYLYLNGRLIARSGETLSGRIVNNSNALTFGKGNSTNVESFTGTLDDVRYFNYMLSDSSVNRLYNLYPIPDTTATGPSDSTTRVDPFTEPLKGVQLFPVPADDRLFLTNLPPSTSVSLFAPDGRLVHSGEEFNTDHTLNVRNHSPGIYILVLRHQGSLLFRKILISHH
jgi:hypothetical protein